MATVSLVDKNGMMQHIFSTENPIDNDVIEVEKVVDGSSYIKVNEDDSEDEYICNRIDESLFFELKQN